MIRTTKIFLSAALVVSLLAAACTDAVPPRGERAVGPDAGPRDAGMAREEKYAPPKLPGGFPYRGDPLYLIGGRPVTEEELRRFHARFLSVPGETGHAAFTPEETVKGFARYWSVVEMGIEGGLAEGKEIRELVDVYRHTALANDYLDRLRRTLLPSEEELKEFLHDEWLRMDFSVKTFPGMEEAERFHSEVTKEKAALGEKAFREARKRHFTNSTGPIFKGSGFFDPFDEDHLFGLKKGDVSRPVKTGIGAGVAYVIDREAMDEKAVGRYLESRKEEAVRRNVDMKVSDIAGRFRHVIHQDNLRRSVLMEGQGGIQSDLPVISLPARKGEITLRYRDFRSLAPQNYAPFFRKYPAESWVNFVLPDLGNLAILYALGEEAVREGIPADGKWDKELFDFRLKSIYFAELDKLARGADVAVDDGEAERFYKENQRFFARDVTLGITYLYSPERAGMESLLEQAGSKGNLFSKDEYKHLRKNAIITRGSREPAEVFAAIERMKAGETSGIVKGGMGYYVVRIETRKEKGTVPFQEAKKDIRDFLVSRKKQEKVREIVEERYRKLVIRKAEPRS